jgi:hypothetical protein
MRNPTIRKWLLPLALSALPVLCGCGPKASSSAPASPGAIAVQQAPANSTPEASPGPQAAVEPAGADTEQARPTNFSAAAYQVMPGEMTLPPTIRSTGPVADVIRLVTSGVDQSVLMGFVTNSANLFNLSSDEIIYLNDLGVPSGVVEAMLQRDRFLKEAAASVAVAPPAPLPSEEIAAPQPPPAPLDITPPASPPPPAAPVTLEQQPPVETVDAGFYDALTPYGSWVDIEGCGPCWQPAVAVLNPGWQPYLDGGRWIYTDCGWYWLSGYSWGWAAFHYGRWFHHDHLGWCWAPDTAWAPAWVSWRNNGLYCGWAALPPGASFSPALGLAFQGKPVSPGFNFGLGTNAFVFVAVGHFLDHHLHRFVLPSGQASRLYAQTTPATTFANNGGRLTNPGLPRARVAGATRSEVRQVALRDESAVGANGAHTERLSLGGTTLAVFRPDLAGAPQRTLTLASAPVQERAESVANRPSRDAIRPQLASGVAEGGAAAGGGAETEARSVALTDPAARGAVVIDQPAAQSAETARPQTASGLRNHGLKRSVGSNRLRPSGAYPQLQAPAYLPWRNPQSERSIPTVQQRPLPWDAPAQAGEAEGAITTRARGQAGEPANRPAEVRSETPRYAPPPEPPQRHESAPAPAPPPAPAPAAHSSETRR